HDERLIGILFEVGHLLVRRRCLRAKTDVQLELPRLTQLPRRRLEPCSKRHRTGSLISLRFLWLLNFREFDGTDALRRNELPTARREGELRLRAPAKGQVMANPRHVPDLILRSEVNGEAKPKLWAHRNRDCGTMPPAIDPIQHVEARVEHGLVAAQVLRVHALHAPAVLPE